MDSSEEHIWDSPWPTDQIRRHGQSWSLAGDAGLLNKLQEMAQTMISRTHQIQQEVTNLVQETDATHSRLHNIINDSLMLSNTQFVESRVYDEEVTDIKTEMKTSITDKEGSAKKESEIIAKVASALHLGMSVFDAKFDTELKDQNLSIDETSEPISFSKASYHERPLPFMIGSQAFLKDDNVGLGGSTVKVPNELHDDIVSASRKQSVDLTENTVISSHDDPVIVKSDSDSSKTSDIFNADEEFQDDNISEIQDKDISAKVDLDKELFAKVASVQQKKQSGHDDGVSNSSSNSEITSSTRKEKRRNQQRPPKIKSVDSSASISSNVFGDDMDDDLFGHKGMFSKKGGLFDDGADEDDIFNSPADIHESSERLQSDKFIKDLATDGGRLSAKLTSKIAQKAPALKDSLFSDDIEEDDDDLFSNIVSKSKSTDKGKVISLFKDNDDDMEEKSSEFLFEKKEVSSRQTESPKSREDDDDAWSSQTSVSNKSLSFHDAVKESPGSGSNKSITLFAAEPEIDDLFNVTFEKRPVSGLLFNDEVDDAGDIFAIKQPKSKPKQIEDTVVNANPPKSMSKKFSLFDDEQDDLFAVTTSLQKQGRVPENPRIRDGSSKVDSLNESKKVKKESTRVSLFDEPVQSTSDLFGSLLPSNPEKSSPSLVASKEKRFLEDDLLFEKSSADNPEINLFDDTSDSSSKMKDEVKKVNVDSKARKNAGISFTAHQKGAENLFDNDDNEEDDLFSNTNLRKAKMLVSPVPSPRKVSSLMKDGIKAEHTLPAAVAQPTSEGANQQHENANSVMDSPRKKPVGGVALFGGVMPPVMVPSRARSPSPANREVAIESKNDVSPSVTGSYIIPPVGSDAPSTEMPASFDDPVAANVLHNTNKDRVKIQVKRRPPTRRGRQEAIRKSAVDLLHDKIDSDSLLNDDGPNRSFASVSAPTSPLSPELSRVIKFPSSVAEPANNKLTVESSRAANIASPSTEEEDLFQVGDPITAPFLTSHARTIHNLGSTSGGDNASTTKSSEDKDLFGGIVDDEDTDDLFKPQSHSFMTVQKANLLSSPRSPRKSKASNDEVAAVDKRSSVASSVDDNEGITKQLKTESLVQPDDRLDIAAEFSKTPITSVTVESAVSITSASMKSKSRLETKAHTRSLFDDDDDDDDDLFKTSSSQKSNAKVFTSSVTASKKVILKGQSKKDSLFNDDEDGDLFEDPLLRGKRN